MIREGEISVHPGPLPQSWNPRPSDTGPFRSSLSATSPCLPILVHAVILATVNIVAGQLKRTPNAVFASRALGSELSSESEHSGMKAAAWVQGWEPRLAARSRPRGRAVAARWHLASSACPPRIGSMLSAYRFTAVWVRRCRAPFHGRGNRGSPCPATLVFPPCLACAVLRAVLASHAVPSVPSPLPPGGCQILKQNKTKQTKRKSRRCSGV